MNTRFGTDGIRGIYGETLTESDAYALGAALGENGEILIGRDNRPSSPILARAITAGAYSVGGKTRAVGVVTTPALYYMLSVSDCPCAVMVTASHNPPQHNGLKVFTKSGKPNERECAEIEERMASIPLAFDPTYPYEERQDLSPYTDYVKRCVGRLDGIKVVLDCAGGAGSVFKGLYREMGADVTVLNAREHGERINEKCGALHPERCAEATVRIGADLGIAIDGDGDRIILVTRRGNVMDGDLVTYLLARRMQAHGRLKKDTVAMTVMTNSGILRCLNEHGVKVISTAVGDTALAEAMRSEELNLGGEQSGHVILRDYLPTGDGILVGALLMRTILEDGDLSSTPLPDLYPQILLNVPAPDRSLASDPNIRRLVEELEASMPEGRILLRASGTESLIRIMVEHPNARQAARTAETLRAEILRYR